MRMRMYKSFEIAGWGDMNQYKSKHSLDAIICGEEKCFQVEDE